MSTHKICFYGEIRKNINTYGLKNKALTSAMSIQWKSYQFDAKIVYLLLIRQFVSTCCLPCI